MSRQRKLFPLLVLFLATAVFLTAHYWPDTNVSSSNLSLIEMGTIIVTVVLLISWLARVPGLRKRNVWLTFFASVAVLVATFKPISMSGRFFPMFGFRTWFQNLFLGGSHDVLLAKQRAAQGRAERPALLTPNPTDMVEYRGRDRAGIITGPALARDWKAHPPREIWRQLVGGGYASFVTANGCLITIEQRGAEEVVACYEATSGLEIWTASWTAKFSETAGGDGPRATPTLAHGNVYAYGATGRLVCLNGSDGKEQWAVDTLVNNKNQRWGMSGSPLVVGDLVIVNPGCQTEESRGRGLLAYDCATGQERWAAGNYPGSYSSPQWSKLHGVEQILIFDGHGLAGHAVADGKQLWRFEFKTQFEINVAQPIIVSDDTVCIGAGYNHGGALVRVTKAGDSWKAEQVWASKNTVMRWKFASAVRRASTDGDYVYGLNDGLLECVNLKTGKPMWKDERRAKREEGYGHGQLLLCDDLIIVLTEYGELVLVEATPERFNELGRIQALHKGAKTWSVPVLVDGKIYVRNEEEMACYDLTGK
jgi:outer membrane protein assembly factor BamB